MNSSAFTVAVVDIVKEFHKTSTEASYLSKFGLLLPGGYLPFKFVSKTTTTASLQVLAMGFGALFWVRSTQPPLPRLLALTVFMLDGHDEKDR